jgi:hypothetical protein
VFDPNSLICLREVRGVKSDHPEILSFNLEPFEHSGCPSYTSRKIYRKEKYPNREQKGCQAVDGYDFLYRFVIIWFEADLMRNDFNELRNQSE